MTNTQKKNHRHSPQQPLIMRILNLTPDSFSDGGCFFSPESAAQRVQELVTEGADIIDLGGESTRPKAELLDPKTEWQRLQLILGRFRRNTLPVKISIDTRSPEVAGQALEWGADIINSVSSWHDQRMFRLLKDFPDRRLVIMHHRGVPPAGENIQTNYGITEELIVFFKHALVRAYDCGLKREQLILDPGLGFGKSYLENLLILAQMGLLVREFQQPFMVGASRKRFVKQLNTSLGEDDLDQTSAIIHGLSFLQGVQILRVHEPLRRN